MMLELNNPDNAAHKTTLFAEVILPVPIPKSFTYRVPFEMNDNIKKGQRAIVQFGRRKILTGAIQHIGETPPRDYEAKYILELLDEDAILGEPQMEFLRWISEYYMCGAGEVLNVMLPSGLKLSSESRVQLPPGFEFDLSPFPFTEHEKDILLTLEGTTNLTYTQIGDITGLKNIYSILKSLSQKEAILIYEEVQDKYKPKIEKRIRLNPELASDEEALQRLFDELDKFPKQIDVLLYYLQHIPAYQEKELNQKGIPKSTFKTAKLSGSSLKTLTEKKVLEEFDQIVSRFPYVPVTEQNIELTSLQESARDQIATGFGKEKPVLLHGITGSGKTEIYIKLMQQTIENGHQVLYLLPEIALTTQIVSRLKKVFGEKLGVYHSKFSDNERVEVWKGMLETRFDVVVGVRSSIFLPFQNLGLIIVDEEHETSYKQMEPAPRYHARDSALMLGRIHHAKILLGSATPSFESYYQVSMGNYELVELNERFGAAHLPDISFANLSVEKKNKKMKGEFSEVLHSEIQQILDANEQAIIFQNRRGYAPYLNCDTCGWIPQCQNCSVSLTFHLFQNELRCHYCGFHQKVPQWCESCNSTDLSTRHFGTEKLEEDLKLFYPDARVRRMDLDTTRKKLSYQKIIQDFEQGEIDILVGTQMVSKGLDFQKVGLVGIFDADRMLHFPDFRAHERTFHLITQVSGRAGRRDKKGKVLIQTHSPEQPVLKLIQKYDYKGFYELEMRERQKFEYAPYFRLIRIIVRHKDPKVGKKAAHSVHQLLSAKLGRQVLGPQEAMIFKVRNLFNWNLIVKLPRNKIQLGRIKDFLKEMAMEVKAKKDFRNMQIIFDVDPY